MTDTANIKKNQDSTREWLTAKVDKNIEQKIKEDIEGLRNVLRFHEQRYYVQNNPLISDFEYDSLYKLLEKYENEHPSVITKDSPTQRVGAGK